MRILITCYPANVHVYPLTPVATALQNAGHEVRVAFHDHPGIRGAVERVGLTRVSLGDPAEHEPLLREDALQLRHPDEVDAYAKVLDLSYQEREHWISYYQQLFCALYSYARPDLPYATELVNFARAWKPDLVLWDPLFPAGAVAARVSGAAHARFLGSCPDWMGYFHPKLEAAKDDLRAAGLAENPLVDTMRPLAERYGVWVDEELLFGQWTVDPLPDGVRLPTQQPKVPVRWIPYAYPEPLAPWLYEQPEKPRVSLSLGESMRRLVEGDWGRTPKIFEAVSGMEIEMVATVNKAQLKGIDRIPPNVRTVDFAPLGHLLPTCSLHIHHGGNGTALPAVANKVPHIVTDTDESLMLRELAPDETAEFTTGDRTDLDLDLGENEVPDEATWYVPAKHMMGATWAEYVTSRGAGIRLDFTQLSVAEIRSEIERVLTEPSFKRGAQSLYDYWLATPGPGEIVPILERLTAEHREKK